MSYADESMDSTAFETPQSTPPPKAANKGTLSSALASLWQSQEAGPSSWGSLLTWGATSKPPDQTASPASKPPDQTASPARVQRGRARAPIPFSISAPLEASTPPPRTTSPRRKPLQGLFDQRPTSPTRQHHESPHGDSPSAAYATLSRLQSKASYGTLRSSATLRTSAPNSGSSSPVASRKPPAAAQTEKLDGYVRNIVFQAGLDYETRPMVVLAACCLPDPKEVDYDALLDRIMDTMDLFVENDYTIIYFAGGGRHRPGWNWIWRAYRRLDRRFRKNLKKLYIVHPTFFTRSLLQFVNTGAYFISPKFSKKVTQLYTLSALAQNVPLTQIDIPPVVLQWNTKYEQQLTIPSSETRDHKADGRIFGVDLVELMGEYGECGGVPRVIRDCIDAILDDDFGGIKPAEVEGIFRRSPSSALLKTAQECYDRGHPVSLVQYRDPHIPAVLLKIFLRSLPRPIFAQSLYVLIRACPNPPMLSADGDDKAHLLQSLDTIDYLRSKLLPAIQPPCSAILLSCVLEMLHRVSLHSDVNKMDAANLATVIAPNLVSSGNAMRDLAICKVEGIASMSLSPDLKQTQSTATSTTLGSILRFCIERYYEIFDETNFEPHIVPGSGVVVESRSPSLHGRAAMHRRGDSMTSNGSLLSTPSSSPWINSGFTPTDEDDDKKSFAPSGSAGYRAPGGFANRSTIARNSSGSLRLTKPRLGSNSNLRASFMPRTTQDTEGLVSQLSGVTLTGLNATGIMTPTVDPLLPPVSPATSTFFDADESISTEDSATTTTTTTTTKHARRRSTRTELSEVKETDDYDTDTQ